ncbi:MAG: KpsF/GutQ family sugar-phosphate isomerase [Hydrogenophilus sp.]|nr:KpsF/GutQ family sugar-phosphate isomerase [Hydrogenophilus sp.]
MTFDPLAERAIATLTLEIAALESLRTRLSLNPQPFLAAVRTILSATGRVIVTGVGKSGHIGRKIAATLASTGTPAYFVHAAEAAHGDLGMITPADVVIALSYSGQSDELLTILPAIKRYGAHLIAITGNVESPLARAAEIHLDIAVAQEACPHNLAPTASTTAMVALGDALAMALLEARGFGPEDFARMHPAGALGRKLLLRVSDVMRPRPQSPTAIATTPILQVILTMTRGGMGMVILIDAEDRPIGIFTDGDLRRLIERGEPWQHLTLGQIAHAPPKTIAAHQLAAEAARLMETHRINQLIVVDEEGRLAGALHTHDLMHAKVI